MSIDRLPGEVERPGTEVPIEVRKGRLDLVVLQFMAKKMGVTLRALEQSEAAPSPLFYSFKGLRGRQHRMILLAPAELLTPEAMRFVGFVSRRSPTAEQQVIDEIFRADELMLKEITHIPGLLSYSSLELHPGVWYNLVLFRNADVKIHVRSGATHRYAAHQLSPAYYEWIRLHNGTLPDGLVHLEMQLNHTKYYDFSGTQQPPIVRELQHETCIEPVNQA